MRLDSSSDPPSARGIKSWITIIGGHIGYGIRPSERRKGYNKINLYLALKEAKKIGLDRVMIDCAAFNIASDKTIQAFGGILERCDKDPADDEMTNVYWINVEKPYQNLKQCMSLTYVHLPWPYRS